MKILFLKKCKIHQNKKNLTILTIFLKINNFNVVVFLY